MKRKLKQMIFRAYTERHNGNEEEAQRLLRKAGVSEAAYDYEDRELYHQLRQDMIALAEEVLVQKLGFRPEPLVVGYFDHNFENVQRENLFLQEGKRIHRDNSTGICGIFYEKRTQKYVVAVTGKRYKTLEEAHNARMVSNS